ncbi:cation transport regulator-like protein 2-like [Hibiscus syriacus]|uniref:Pectinesterase n=1 Tax=Hibiscus syriacus TaxID=106335 RepID=A0A6A3C4E9_HIBSY|nr:pectinesterase-like [Hibiscus syriacus]KAE8723227.1 cation transport regulator-like protein 2-like [Hibiscus syriacus]
MSAKIIISAVSVILLIGVAIGVVAVVQYKKSHEGSDLSPSMKAVSNFCSSTDHQDSCQKTLGSVNSTDPKEYIMKSILAAEDAVRKFFNYSNSLIVTVKNDSRTRMGLQDCKDMMDYAVQSLQASYSEVGDAKLHNMSDRVSDLRTWLSAVISYQQSCLDGLEDDHSVKKNMTEGITDATQLTSNALAIVTKLTEILAKFGLHLNVPSSRKLLSVEKHGYLPSWFSDVDRKLFARIDNNNIKPDAVVAKDGSGQFRTIAAALAAAPKNSAARHVIYVKAGIYDEYITLDKSLTNILMFGDGPRRTIVTGRKNFVDGVQTWKTATFSAIGTGFVARSMGFQNTAGAAKHQAVALRIQSDKSAFFNCRMDAYQDTLYVQANRQFFRNCVISGTIDFIFGDSPTVIQNSLIIVRKPLENQANTVTAQGKSDPNENTGLVIQNCRIVPEEKFFPDRLRLPTYLGRPWRKFSTTVIMESTLGDLIRPEGWTPWAGSAFEDTLYYAEYNNRGPGANLVRRVNWKGYHKIDRNTAMTFAPQPFLLSRENWLPATGIPYIANMRN